MSSLLENTGSNGSVESLFTCFFASPDDRNTVCAVGNALTGRETEALGSLVSLLKVILMDHLFSS